MIIVGSNVKIEVVIPQRLSTAEVECVLLSPEELQLLPTEAEVQLTSAPRSLWSKYGYSYPSSMHISCSPDEGLVLRTSGGRLKEEAAAYIVDLVELLGEVHIIRTKPLPEEVVSAEWTG
jgi:hypothetical protein